MGPNGAEFNVKLLLRLSNFTRLIAEAHRRCTKDEIWMEAMAAVMFQPMRAEKEVNTDDFLYPSN